LIITKLIVILQPNFNQLLMSAERSGRKTNFIMAFKSGSTCKCDWCGKEYQKSDSLANNRMSYCCQKCEAEAKAAGKK
jgi:hypothetical protein